MSVRPLYETGETLRAERAAIDRFCLFARCSATKLPRFYRVDFDLHRGDQRVVAWCEAKERPGYTFADLARMGGYDLSVHKWMAGVELLRVTARPFVVVVVDKASRLYWAAFTDPDAAIEIVSGRGRFDRNDDQDIEPVVRIPTRLFREVA